MMSACETCVLPLQVPHVNRQEYSLLDISEDGFVSTCSTSVCISHATSVAWPVGALQATVLLAPLCFKDWSVYAVVPDGRGW